MAKALPESPFLKNLDLYPSASNVDVSFYQELYKYKSVEDYLKNKNKKKKKKLKRRKMAFTLALAGDTNHLDFLTDQETTPIPYSSEMEGANQIGGIVDHVTPGADWFDTTVGSLNYGVSKDQSYLDDELGEEDDAILLSPAEPALKGIPDGLDDPQATEEIYERPGIANFTTNQWAVTDSTRNPYGNGTPTQTY